MIYYKNKLLIEKLPLSPKCRLEEMIDGLELKFDFKKYPVILFFLKEDKIFFEQYRSGSLECSVFNVWEVLRQEYDLGHEEIQTIIKEVIEEYFRLEPFGKKPSILKIKKNVTPEKGMWAAHPAEKYFIKKQIK